MISKSVSLLLLAACSAVAGETNLNNQRFTLPDGFSVELVAGADMVPRPISADFDEAGRLYVSDSSGSNDKVEKQLAEKPHRILRLVDQDGDGKFDKTTVFADKMMFPEGILYHQGAVYCAAPPSIWKLEDTDGDGVADKRNEWFKGETLTGCANDLHGPYLGPDGFIYWCKGAFAKQTHQLEGGKKISDSAARIFRMRPDGSQFDSVMSGGMDNPVEIAFSTEGEAFFTTTFYTNPNAGKRDALVHAIYGSVFPKVHGVLDGLIRTGELMPAMTHLGPAAPSGLMRYSSKVFGDDFEGNLFSTLFNMRKVQRHILQKDGGTFKTIDSDLIASDNPDFHPTDVLEDADGSLLIIDTGGWYKLCCPTSQIAKPEVLGGIYRIRRHGMKAPTDPRGRKIQWSSAKPSELIDLLNDARPEVVKQAAGYLVSKGGANLETIGTALKSHPSVKVRQNLVWISTQMPGKEARELGAKGLEDSDQAVRLAAIHSVGINKIASALPKLSEFLMSKDLHQRRAAATALGQIGKPEAVPSLMAAAKLGSDRSTEHSIIYALIQIGDSEKIWSSIDNKNEFSVRTGLIALDQMPNGNLTAEKVKPFLNSPHPVINDTVAWIVPHHPDWQKDFRDYFELIFSGVTSDTNQWNLVASRLSWFMGNPEFQAWTMEKMGGVDAIKAVFGAMASKDLKSVDSSVVETTARLLEGGLRAEVIAGAPNLYLPEVLVVAAKIPLNVRSNTFERGLVDVASQSSNSGEVRLNALNILRQPFELNGRNFKFLLENLDPEIPPRNRGAAASVLSRSSLTRPQLFDLLEKLTNSGPMELGKLLEAFGNSTWSTVGEKLLETIENSRIRTLLRYQQVTNVFAKYPEPLRVRAAKLFSNFETENQAERLTKIKASLKAGNAGNGHLVFNSSKAACATCHQVGYLGGKVGPDLSRIGAIRTEMDLLEAIVFPSASFVRSYEPSIVVTKTGDQHSGILQQESNQSIALVTGPNAEVRLRMDEIAETRPGTISLMPEGLDQVISKDEISDLMAFLKSLK